MIALRLLIWVIAIGFTALMLLGCDRTDPGGPTRPRDVWREHAMSGGPTIYWACVHGRTIYALQPLASRASNGLWPGASIAVDRGCP